MKLTAQTNNSSGDHTNTGGRTNSGLLLLLPVLFLLLALPQNSLADKGWQKARGSQRWQEHTQRFVLDFNDRRLRGHRGEPAVLFLKKELLRQYPGVDVTDLRLRNVVLVAKTRAGRGAAQLRVGPELSKMYQVAGNPPAFRSRNRHSYDRTHIGNPFRPSWGPWQLHLRGHFKVHRVVLEVEKRHRAQYGWGHRPGGWHMQMRW